MCNGEKRGKRTFDVPAVELADTALGPATATKFDLALAEAWGRFKPFWGGNSLGRAFRRRIRNHSRWGEKRTSSGV